MSVDDDVENAKESMEEKIPKILHYELQDVPMFVSMLDANSFTNLAMTSKEMYNRCMEDKAIKISVNVDYIVSSSSRYGSVEFNMSFRNGTNRDFETAFAIIKDFDVNSLYIDGPIELDVLRSTLKLSKFILISEKTKTEIWFRGIDKVIRKLQWNGGRLCISEGALRESPPSFMIFRYLAQGRVRTELSLSLEQFRSCLEQFAVVPFDYNGPLKNEPTMAIVKNEIRHTCRPEATCRCSEVSSIFAWILWDGVLTRECSNKKRRQLECRITSKTHLPF